MASKIHLIGAVISNRPLRMTVTDNRPTLFDTKKYGQLLITHLK